MQTLTVLVVCVYVFHMASAANTTTAVTATTATTLKPSLACSSDGTLTYTGIPPWVKSATAECGTATVNQTSKTIVIKGCKVGQTATVFMYSLSTAQLSNSILKGTGDKVNTIAISCTYTVNGEYQVNMKFPGSDTSTAFTATVKEPITLKMSLTNFNGTNKPTKVVIGHQYSLHIKGGGNSSMNLLCCREESPNFATVIQYTCVTQRGVVALGNHYMRILTCTAAGEHSMTNAVTVYNANTKDGDKLGVISPLNDTSTSHAGPHPLKATLTGFRLVNSLTVYLECSVKVCDSPNCPPGTKRKRTKSSLKTASLKFEVVSTQSPRQVNGARDINTSGKFTLTFAMVIVARYITFK